MKENGRISPTFSIFVGFSVFGDFRLENVKLAFARALAGFQPFVAFGRDFDFSYEIMSLGSGSC